LSFFVFWRISVSLISSSFSLKLLLQSIFFCLLHLSYSELTLLFSSFFLCFHLLLKLSFDCFWTLRSWSNNSIDRTSNTSTKSHCLCNHVFDFLLYDLIHDLWKHHLQSKQLWHKLDCKRYQIYWIWHCTTKSHNFPYQCINHVEDKLNQAKWKCCHHSEQTVFHLVQRLFPILRNLDFLLLELLNESFLVRSQARRIFSHLWNHSQQIFDWSNNWWNWE